MIRTDAEYQNAQRILDVLGVRFRLAVEAPVPDEGDGGEAVAA